MCRSSSFRRRSSFRSRASVLALACALAGCPGDDGDDGGADGAATTSTGTASTDEPATTAPTPPADTTLGATTDDGDTTDATTSSPDDGSTGEPACTKTVVLMGYWPPTNEMLRPWSTNPAQNPGPWIGADWEGYGYDVHSFFPEFPPDGDPTNDSIGDDGAVGSPRFDLRVDYQATSADFWRIVDEMQPSIIVTTSRGGEIGWELEALEGGHGAGNPGDPAFDWSSDQHGAETRPTQDSIEARSWDAITTWRQGTTLPSQLPLDDLLAANDALGLTTVAIDQTGTSGNFLSGFLGLHGLAYHDQTPHAVAAGHIHVGFGLPVETASQLIETTLHTVLAAHPIDDVPCPP